MKKTSSSFYIVLVLLSISCPILGGNFSLLISNVLMHSFYVGYSNKWVVDVKDRIASFNEEMAKAKAQELACKRLAGPAVPRAVRAIIHMPNVSCVD